MSYIKLFFNILKAHKINVILPLAIVIIFSAINTSTINSNVSDYEPPVYIVDKDNTEFSKELVEELDKHTNIKEYKGNEDIEEELMKSWISLYIEIPEGFTDSFNEFKNSEEAKFKSKDRIIIKSIENSKSRIFVDEKIDNFLNSKLNNTELKENDFIKLDVSSAISTDDTSAKISAISFAAYGVLYGIPSIIGTFFMIIRKKNIKDRYSCSPVSNKTYLTQVVLASICVTVIYDLILSVFIMNILFKTPINGIWLLNFANILVLSILGIALGLLFGIVVKNLEALNGIGVGVSLALAFLGGLFVPLEIFSDTMRKIATFTPTYWYEQVNNMLNSGANNVNTGELLTAFGIQCIFIVAVFAVVAIINKKKQAE